MDRDHNLGDPTAGLGEEKSTISRDDLAVNPSPSPKRVAECGRAQVPFTAGHAEMVADEYWRSLDADESLSLSGAQAIEPQIDYDVLGSAQLPEPDPLEGLGPNF